MKTPLKQRRPKLLTFSLIGLFGTCTNRAALSIIDFSGYHATWTFTFSNWTWSLKERIFGSSSSIFNLLVVLILDSSRCIEWAQHTWAWVSSETRATFKSAITVRVVFASRRCWFVYWVRSWTKSRFKRLCLQVLKAVNITECLLGCRSSEIAQRIFFHKLKHSKRAHGKIWKSKFGAQIFRILSSFPL